MNVKKLFELMRPKQWFKSLSILFGTSVALYSKTFAINLLPNILIALIATSLLSSTIYVFNDIADVKEDMMHPVKKKRPIASGEVTILEASLFGIILLLVSLSLLYCLKPMLLVVGFLFLLNNFLYSFKPFRLKDMPIVDVFSAALNFSLRVLIGWYAFSNVLVYKTVLLFPFFIAGFLLSCKRLAEYNYLGKKAPEHRAVYKYYNAKSLNLSVNIYLVLSTLFYFLFSDLFNKKLLWLGPWFFAEMYWYKTFSKDKDSIVKKPEDVFEKKKLFTITGALFCLTWIIMQLLP
ncbi:4-hydroxybenzoate octaprenyltransferase [Candidatus Tiddalikarchaeum anstoanum]|nr:4-hydroxybenzoate octaprenyltransferase [Candidatus Tiddalikarchaeum anstoanum]